MSKSTHEHADTETHTRITPNHNHCSSFRAPSSAATISWLE